MKDNQHTQFIPSDVVNQVQTEIQEIQPLLAPYMLVFTPAERRELPKMGGKTLSFVEKAYDFARQTPNLVLPYLDLDAIRCGLRRCPRPVDLCQCRPVVRRGLR
jgi:hypothetical protein